MSETSPNFALQKIYVKDVSFESPQPVKYFTNNVKPKINIDLQTESRLIENDAHEVTLCLTVSAKLEDSDDVVYLVEIKQAGIFSITGFSKEDGNKIINCHCPNILFPYAREAVSGLVERGGFPQLLLAPMNFEALYEQHLQKLKSAAENVETEAKH